jgi:hypothetical protein
MLDNASLPLESRRPRAYRALATIVALLVLFGTLAYTASLRKNATFDETLHAPAAWVHLVQGEFRVNPEHPVLWKYYCALPLILRPVHDPLNPELWKAVIDNLGNQWTWSATLMYRTPGNDGQAILNACRFMMTLIGVALAATLARIAWRLGGPVAGVVAAALFCLDPNFTAHAPLVTNDVAFSLAMLATAYAVYRAGERLTWTRLAAIAVLCGVAVCVKYSAMLLGPIVFLLLTARALGREDWVVLGHTLTTRARRMAAVALVCAVSAAVAFVIIWGTYRFRYAAAADGGPINWKLLEEYTRINDLYAKHPGAGVTDDELKAWHPTALYRGVLFFRDHRLLPEAFLYGVLHVHMGSLVRQAYLMGQTNETGWWYYFPLAMLFKTPLSTLAAWVGAAIVGAGAFRAVCGDARRRWLAICIATPIAVYMYTSMRMNLNLGLRHVFPVYPLLYLATALAAARLWAGRATRATNATVDQDSVAPSESESTTAAAAVNGATRPQTETAAVATTLAPAPVAPPGLRFARALVVVLLLGLALESLPTYPDYIPFFNRAAGGSRGGFRLLGDSNLDWGQDLIGLAAWQKKNPNTRLYFCYFGSADPWFYGIRYTNMPGGYSLGPPVQAADTPGVIAISATALQGLYLGPLHRSYEWMLRAEPMEVIGGSIYLFEYPYPKPLKPKSADTPAPRNESVRPPTM